MPVRKYRSVEEMPSPSPFAALDPENIRRVCDLSELAIRLRPRRLAPGIYKYRSVEEADRARENWERSQER